MRTPALDVYLLDPPTGGAGELRGPRIGWIVPKLGHGSVERNRLKRRLREIGRRRVLKRLREVECRVDVLVRARRGGYRATYQELEAQWMRIVEVACSHR